MHSRYLIMVNLLLTLTLCRGSIAWAQSAEPNAVNDKIKSVRERLKALEDAEKAEPIVVASPEKKEIPKLVQKKTSRAVGNRGPASVRGRARGTGNSVHRDTQVAPPVPTSPEEEENRLTKNWGGSRKTLSDKGIDLALVYKAEVSRNFSGGAQSKTVYLGNFDLRGSFDGEKLVGWKGGSAFVYFLGDHGGHPSENVGDSQVTSNLETAGPAFKLFEAWIQQLAFDDKVSFLIGLHDLNSEFYVTDTSSLFFNASFGVGRDLSQTGTNGPSIFPNAALAFRTRVEPSKDFYLQTGVFNSSAGNPSELNGTHVNFNFANGYLIISEAAYVRGKADTKQLYGKYGIGTWNYTRTFDHQMLGTQATSSGSYFLAEQTLVEGMAVFSRFGVSSTEVNSVANNLSGGVVFTGLIPSRSKDRFGLAFTRIQNGTEFKDQQALAGTPVLDSETTYETNYRFEVMPGVALQPDLQYVVHPSTDPAKQNALAGNLRLELNF